MESLEKDEDLPHRKEVSLAGRPPKFHEEHKEFSISMVDEKPDLVLDEMMEQLSAQFTNLRIEKSAVHKFLIEICQISLERAHFHSVERNSLTKIEKRYNWSNNGKKPTWIL